MDNTYTHIAMIIDRSGSMSSCWTDVKGGYAELVKQNKSEAGKCTFSVAAFDTEYDLVEDFTDIKNVKEELTVSPRGGTALLDAIGKTVVSVGEKLAKLDEKDRPMKVLVVIQTDGYENASKEFNKDQIKALIDKQTDEYQWQFQFIGASLDAVADAQSWGIRAGNSSTYNTDNSLDTFTLLGEKMRSARSAVDLATYASVVAFSPEEKVTLNAEK